MFKFKRRKKKMQIVEAKTLSEKEVLQRLNIKSFKRMKKDKIPEFCVLMQQMEPEVIKSAIDQFPNYASMMTEIIVTIKDMANNVLQVEIENRKSFNEACNTILDTLSVLLQQKRIKRKEREKITEQMMEIAKLQRIENKDSREWQEKLVKVFTSAAIAIPAVVGLIIKSTIK